MPLTNLSKIPIAVVGLNFGRHIIDSQLLSGPGAPYFSLAGICDIDERRAAESSAAFNVKVYADLDEILADPAVPAVALYTGPFRRGDLLRKIIRAGKDVITTKPFELNPELAFSVMEEARQIGRVVHLNSPAPVCPMDIQQILDWQKSYDLGQPVGCRADVWARYQESADGTWLDDPEKCPVAPIFRLGIYLINDLIALFGPADEVQVFSSRLTTGRPTPDTAQLGIRFKNGGLANVFASFCVKDGDHYRDSLTLNFQNGTIYRNAGPIRSASADNSVSELSLVVAQGNERVLVEQKQVNASGHYRWDLFYRAMRGEQLEGEISPEQVAGGLKVIRAMTEAAKTGQTVCIH